MKIHREGHIPGHEKRRLTKGNREPEASAWPATGGEETGHVRADDHEGGARSAASGNRDEQQLLALLRDLVGREGPVKAAEGLGVTYRTVMRAIETHTLTGRMEDALKRLQLEAGGAVVERLDVLERRQGWLETGLTVLAREVEQRLADLSIAPGEVLDALPARDSQEQAGEPVGAGRKAMTPRKPDGAPALRGAPPAPIGPPEPDVVTREPQEDEALLFGEAAPLIAEWREARQVRWEAERYIDWLDTERRICQLEITLIREHWLTLPPSTDPWDAFAREAELGLRKRELRNLRAARRRELRDGEPRGQPGGRGKPTGGRVEARGGAAVDRTPAGTGAPRAVIGQPGRGRFPLGHPEVVTVEPMPEEEFDYGEAAPLVVEWRRARAAFLSHGSSRVERARGGVRMCELQLLIIGDHELTMPPSTYPWDESRRHDELYWVKASLAHARWALVQALFWRWVRRVLTLGLWWR